MRQGSVFAPISFLPAPFLLSALVLCFLQTYAWPGAFKAAPGSVVEEQMPGSFQSANVQAEPFVQVFSATPEGEKQARTALERRLDAEPDGRVTIPRGFPALGPERSDVEVDLAVWYKKVNGAYDTIYEAEFSGNYTLRNPNEQWPSHIVLTFPFPRNAEMLWDVKLTVNDQQEGKKKVSLQALTWSAWFKAKEVKTVHVEYVVRGQDEFAYLLDDMRENRYFRMVATVRGATKLELPTDILPLSREPEITDDGQTTKLVWFYTNMVTTKDARITLPQKQPEVGFAGRLDQYQSLFQRLLTLSPLLTALFLALSWLAVKLSATRLSIGSLALLGLNCLIFAPLVVFSAALIGVAMAFWLSLGIVTLIATMYCRLVVPQLARTVLFLMLVVPGAASYAILHPAYQGLLTSLAGLVTVVYFMALFTAARRAQPQQRFASESASIADVPPAAEGTALDPAGAADYEPQTGAEESLHDQAVERPLRFCTNCGAELAEGFSFCPGCAGPVPDLTTHCPGCGRELCATCAQDYKHCPSCGNQLTEDEE